MATVWEEPHMQTVVDWGSAAREGRQPAVAVCQDRILTRRPAVERRLDDDRVLIDATGKAMYVLNQTAWAIWELCDGQRSAAEIVTELARRYRTEEASMAAACLGFLGALQAADLVVEAGR